MGLFDYVSVSDARFVCSEGHDLSGCEFQSKDFGETMGTVVIDADGRIDFIEGYCGKPEPDSTTAEIYCDCQRCPAFVQDGTGNLCPCPVEFRITIVGDRVTGVERISDASSDWLSSEPKKEYMRNCEGPMPFEEAKRLHIFYGDMRPERKRLAHERWKRWRAALDAAKPGEPVGTIWDYDER